MARQEMGVVVDNGSFDVEESDEAVGTKKVEDHATQISQS